MKRIGIGLFIVLACATIGMGQDLFETGELLIDVNYDDFDTSGLNATGLSDPFVFDDIPGNETGALEFEIPGGTENAWSEQLSTNFDKPENCEDVTWRIQYRVRVENTPYNIQLRMQITEDPWTGFSLDNPIPAGTEGKWLLYDFLASPFASFSTDQINFSLRFGAQDFQLMQIDDIRLYNSNALRMSSFESSADERMLKSNGVELERVEKEDAPAGAYVMAARVVEPGDSLSSASLILPYAIIRDYSGAYRITLAMRSNVANFEVRGGITEKSDFTASLVYAQETVTIAESDTWTTVSFLVQPLTFSASRVYPFLQFGGQGEAEIQFDRFVILRTDEVVENPVYTNFWSLY